MTNLEGKVALVTGATRGVGKGVVLELANAGAIVYATGRTMKAVTFRGSDKIVPVRCDHTNDLDVEAVFHQIIDERRRIDILVNNFWGGYENMGYGNDSWETRPPSLTTAGPYWLY